MVSPISRGLEPQAQGAAPSPCASSVVSSSASISGVMSVEPWMSPACLRDHALRHIEHRHDNIEGVGQDQDGTSGFEHPFVDIRHVNLVHIVLFQKHLYQLIGGNKGQHRSRQSAGSPFRKAVGSGRKTPAFHAAGVVPTCAAISPTWVLTVSKSPSRFPMIPPIRSSLSQFVSQSVRKSISAYLKTGQTAEGSVWCQ